MATAVERKHAIHSFDLSGEIFAVTGGARGLGLTMAEGLAEAGGTVYCLDVLAEPDKDFEAAQTRLKRGNKGSLAGYYQVDVREDDQLNRVFDEIGDKHQRLDGVLAAAGVQQVTPALEYKVEDIRRMMDINYMGVFLTARNAARVMNKYKIRGRIALVGSISGFVANKGLICPVYNSSKAAVTQLARNLAMEWGRVQEDGTGGLRVNTLSPGNIITPMVLKNFEEVPGLKEKWESENMMGRLASPDEFKSAGVFLLSSASSFMTGSNLVMDAGYSSW